MHGSGFKLIVVCWSSHDSDFLCLLEEKLISALVVEEKVSAAAAAIRHPPIDLLTELHVSFPPLQDGSNAFGLEDSDGNLAPSPPPVMAAGASTASESLRGGESFAWKFAAASSGGGGQASPAAEGRPSPSFSSLLHASPPSGGSAAAAYLANGDARARGGVAGTDALSPSTTLGGGCVC